MKTLEQEAVAPQPGSGALASRTTEHGGPGRGHDGTVDTPAAESEPPEDRDIQRTKSPTPASETFTRAESTPPPPTPSHTATTSPAPLPSVPHDTTNPHPPQQIAVRGSRDTRPPNARNKPSRPAPNHTTNLNPRCTMPPNVGEAVEGVTEHELERSRHFPIIFFRPPQNVQFTSTRFQDVPYFLTFLCQLHTSQTSHILYIFEFLSPV